VGTQFDLESLKSLIERAALDKLTESDIHHLVKCCRVIITSYIINTKSHINKLTEKSGLTATDLAYDVIGDVLYSTSNSKFPLIKNFVSRLNKPINSLPGWEVYSAFKSLLFRFSDIHISKIYSELDPNGAKILRNIKENVSKINELELLKNSSGFIIACRNSDSFSNLPYLELNYIEEDFIHIAKQKNNTEGMLTGIHEILSEQELYRKEIKLNDLVILFKKYFQITEEFLHSEEEILNRNNHVSLLDETDYQIFFEKICDNYFKRIILTYFEKGKTTLPQSKAMCETLKDVLYDWVQLGKNGSSYYDYFCSHYEIDRRIYNEHIKSKIEYLIKEAKKEFVYYLEEN
jgi:hypothetical protein